MLTGNLGDTATYLLNAAAYSTFAALLLATCVTDLRERLIPDRIPLGIAGVWLAWKAGVLVACLLGAHPEAHASWSLAAAEVLQADLLGPIVCALAIGGGLLLFTLAFEAITKRTGLGGGDIKLIAACALYLGIEGSAACLLIACIAAIPLAHIIPHTRFARTDERTGALPFGPAIAVGALVTLLL